MGRSLLSFIINVIKAKLVMRKMNGLLFLSKNDFYISETPMGALLNSTIRHGFFVILFYSTQCQYCKAITPIFQQLPSVIHGVQFGMINVSTNTETVHMSRKTIAPIEYVPYIVLYVNGEPAYKYNGPVTVGDIQQFIMTMSKQFGDVKQRFVQPSTNPSAGGRPQEKPTEHDSPQQRRTIPAYTIGLPFLENERTYLEYDEAYH
jgi:thioredoxin-like negative regulator of GroEL